MFFLEFSEECGKFSIMAKKDENKELLTSKTKRPVLGKVQDESTELIGEVGDEELNIISEKEKKKNKKLINE